MVQLDQVKLIIPRGKLSALSARIEQKNKKTTQLPVSSVTASCCKLLFAVRASKQTCLIRLGSSTKRSGSFYSDRCFSSERRWGPCICHICEVIHQPARCDAYVCDEEGGNHSRWVDHISICRPTPPRAPPAQRPRIHSTIQTWWTTSSLTGSRSSREVITTSSITHIDHWGNRIIIIIY